MTSPTLGHIVHTDLTVPNAEEVLAFYAKVCGWSHAEVSMGDYADYMMSAPGVFPVRDEASHHNTVGICHARGDNADMPAQWILYVDVADLDASLKACDALGGKLKTKIRSYGKSRFCVIEDPAGAVIGLFENSSE